MKINISEFGKVLIRFASAQVISNFLRLISGFLVVKFLDPSLYGEYTGVGVYLGYILLGQGGIINGLGRELPYELGKGNDKYAQELASSVFILSLIIGGIASITFFSISIHFFTKGTFLPGIIYLSYAIIGLMYVLNSQFLPVLYRTNKDFNSLSKQNIRFGIGNFLTVVLVYFFSIHGLIIRGVVLAIYQFTLLYYNKPYKLLLLYKISHFKKLIKTGLPIFVVGYINPLWSTVINNLIFSLGGALSFGLYSLSTIVQGAFGVIPTSFSGVIYPRMSIMLGQGKSVSEILRANIKPLFFQFGVMLVIAIVGYFLLPLIIPIALPKYVQGIKAAQWMLFVPVALSFGSLNHIYNVTKKQFWYFVALVIGVAIGSLYILIQYRIKGFYLEVFPQGLLLGRIIQQLLSISFIKILVNNDRRS